MSRRTHCSRAARVAAVLFAVGVSGCSLATDNNSTIPTGLVYYTGEGQTAGVSTKLPTSLGVFVINQFGQQLQGAEVKWEIVSGGGTLSAPTSITNDSGIAVVDYTTGTTTGPVIITATVTGVPPLAFHETVS